jgi:hypothetical protein
MRHAIDEQTAAFEFPPAGAFTDDHPDIAGVVVATVLVDIDAAAVGCSVEIRVPATELDEAVGPCFCGIDIGHGRDGSGIGAVEKESDSAWFAGVDSAVACTTEEGLNLTGGCCDAVAIADEADGQQSHGEQEHDDADDDEHFDERVASASDGGGVDWVGW